MYCDCLLFVLRILVGSSPKLCPKILDLAGAVSLMVGLAGLEIVDGDPIAEPRGVGSVVLESPGTHALDSIGGNMCRACIPVILVTRQVPPPLNPPLSQSPRRGDHQALGTRCDNGQSKGIYINDFVIFDHRASLLDIYISLSLALSSPILLFRYTAFNRYHGQRSNHHCGLPPARPDASQSWRENYCQYACILPFLCLLGYFLTSLPNY